MNFDSVILRSFKAVPYVFNKLVSKVLLAMPREIEIYTCYSI